MDKKFNRKPLAVALGTAFAASMSFASIASADNANPFEAQELSSGYMQLAGAGEGSCGGDKAGEGSCGGDKAGEGSCGGDKEGDHKDGEGSCGGDKAGEGSCGGDKAGEGSCGGDKE